MQKTKCLICGSVIINTYGRPNAVCKGAYVNGKWQMSNCRREYRKQYIRQHRQKIKKNQIEYRRRKKMMIQQSKEEQIVEQFSYKKRKCLKCNKQFDSLSKYNRICENCKRSNERYGLETHKYNISF